MNRLNAVVFLIVSMSFSGSVFSQTGRWTRAIDNPEISNADKVYYTDSLILHYRKSNPDSAIYYSRRLLFLARDLNDTSSADYATMHLGSLMRITGEYDSSVYYYKCALFSYEQQHFEEGMASVYNNIATVHKTQGRYDLAIKNYIEALEVFKNSDNYNALGNLYSSFAGLYFKLENFEKAREYWLLAEKAHEKAGNKYEITHSYRGQARLYMQGNEFDEAEKMLKKSLKLNLNNGFSVLLIEDYLLFLELYILKKDITRFKEIVAEIEPLLDEYDSPYSMAAYFEYSGDFQILEDNLPGAQAKYDSSLTYLSAQELPEIRLRVLKKLFKVNLKLGQLNSCLSQLEEIEYLEKLTAGLRRDRITQETDAEYDLKNKEEKIKMLNDKNRTAEQLVEKERELQRRNKLQIVWMWIGIAGFCMFLIYAVITNRKLNRTQKELKKNVDQKEFLFRELNHRVKNNLHIVNSFLGIEMHGKSEEVQEILKVCESRIHSLGLMHEMLYQDDLTGDIELKTYLEKLSQFLSKTLASEKTTLEIKCSEKISVSGQKIVLIGLITNELVTNAIKYAKDPLRDLKIQIVALTNDADISISVTDNGIGLKEEFNPQKSNSLGMKMAYGLTRQLGGTFSYQNADPGSSFIFSFKN